MTGTGDRNLEQAPSNFSSTWHPQHLPSKIASASFHDDSSVHTCQSFSRVILMVPWLAIIDADILSDYDIEVAGKGLVSIAPLDC
jgi:hypothetical protein